MSAIAEAAKNWVNAGLGLLYPEVCQLCGAERATPAEGYVCGGCRGKVRFIVEPFCRRCGRPFEGAITTEFECANCREMEWHFQSAHSAVLARDPVLEVIHRYKYPRLPNALPRHRASWELVGGGHGIHWPELDEDISVENVLLGQPSGESGRSFARWKDWYRQKVAEQGAAPNGGPAAPAADSGASGGPPSVS